MSTKSSFHILLVEDDEGHAILLQEDLRSHGVANEISVVTDGQQALDYLYHVGDDSTDKDWPRPGLILLDLKMPIVDGFEVLQKIKGDDHLKNIPVVVISSTEAPNDISKCFELGADDYLTKPVLFADFKEKIGNLNIEFEMIVKPKGLK